MVKENIYTTYSTYMQNEYLEYQKKYSHNIPERDKSLVRLLRQNLPQPEPGRQISLLDVGCSSGNLLLHLKNIFPSFVFSGSDAYPDIVEHCQRDDQLNDIRFYLQDIRSSPSDTLQDIIIANAVLQALGTEELSCALQNIFQSLRSGGLFLGLAWWHNYQQEIAIVETCATHTAGNPLYIRSFDIGREMFSQVGFSSIEFFPFEIPIDIPEPKDNRSTGTHTVRSESGTRLQFRGSLYQPWCHFVARKP